MDDFNKGNLFGWFIEPDTSIKKTMLLGGKLSSSKSLALIPICKRNTFNS